MGELEHALYLALDLVKENRLAWILAKLGSAMRYCRNWLVPAVANASVRSPTSRSECVTMDHLTDER
ncbi:hypothetical protein [Xaviernesmea oryzae]|uniref:hypothetical protein n=1 Tax=Xaviernesmea oryzae TaxID=464029 RepID=UPI000B3278D8|nr:hypothetical protein [Xaviernesmea oryzae]